MIIAEIGQNHSSDMQLAKTMIGIAQECNADKVKFQLFDYEKLYPTHVIPDWSLSKKQAFDLFDYGNRIGIEVFFSVFDTERVQWCEEMGVKTYKLAGTLKDSRIAKAVLETGKYIISSYPRIYIFENYPFIDYLYCINKYPVTLEELRFNVVPFDNVYQGYSDHTIGIEACQIALSRGAKIIEKHFSLEYNMGIDGRWSMLPMELLRLKQFENTVRKVL